MKIVKTAAVGSLVALAGSGALAHFGPLVPQGVVEILLYRPGRDPLPLAAFRDHVHQWGLSSAWSAIGAVAFAAGLTIAAAALAHANRSRGASVFCRPLLFLAAATAMAAATPMFLATGYFFLTFRALLMSDSPLTQLGAEQFRQSLTLGPLYTGFALLVGVSASLVAASFLKTTDRPPSPANRLMTMNVVLIALMGLVFAAAFVLSCAGARRLCWDIAGHGQLKASVCGSIMYAIVTAQLIASVCLVGLSVALAGLACLLQTKKTHIDVSRDDLPTQS